MELFTKCSGFRALFAQILFSEDETFHSEDNDDRELASVIEKILIKTGVAWKQVRRSWLALIVEVAMKVNKKFESICLV
jgi:hypothetical protein